MMSCPMCESKAIFTDEKGNSRCVRCFPYREGAKPLNRW